MFSKRNFFIEGNRNFCEKLEEKNSMQLGHVLRYSIISLVVLLILTIPIIPKWGSLVLVTLGIVGIGNVIYKREPIQVPLFFYFLIGAYAVRVLWLLRATDIEYGLKCLETESALLAVPVIFSMFKLTDREKKLAIDAFVLMSFLIIAYSLFHLYAFIYTSSYSLTDYLVAHLNNRKQFSETNMLNWRFALPSFLSVIIIYGFTLFFLDKRTTGRRTILLVIFACAAIIFIILSGSRFGLFMFVLAGFFCLIIRLNSSLKRSLLIVNIFIFVSAILVLVFIPQSRSRAFYERLDPLRVVQIERAVIEWKKNPWLGFGTGSTKEVIRNVEWEKIDQIFNHPHNQYLTELIQFGIIGSIPLMMFLITAFAFGIKTGNRELISILVLFSIFMLVESPINSNKGLVPFLVVVSLLVNNVDDRFKISLLHKSSSKSKIKN